MCQDGANTRQIVPLTAGDLVFTEVMPDPKLVSDAVGEYYEVLIKADADLNGLAIAYDGTARLTLSSATCLRVTAGTRLVFARSDVSDPGNLEFNGGIPLVDFVSTFQLTNSNAHTLSASVGEVDLDSFTYTGSAAGVSTQVDPDFETPEGNDDAANLCATPLGTTYGAGDRGTPNLPNVQCP
jgi:hypothetical protein